MKNKTPLLILAALAIAGYWWYRKHQSQTASASNSASLADQLSQPQGLNPVYGSAGYTTPTNVSPSMPIPSPGGSTAKMPISEVSGGGGSYTPPSGAVMTTIDGITLSPTQLGASTSGLLNVPTTG